MPVPVRVPRRVPQESFSVDAGWGARAELSVRGFEGLFPACRAVHADHGGTVAARAAGGGDHADAVAGRTSGAAFRAGGPQRSLSLRQRAQIQEVPWSSHIMKFARAALAFLIPGLLLAQSGFVVGSSAITVGAGAGNTSVELLAPAGAAWTAASNASWLHIAANSVSGAGSSLVQFSYDANTSPGVLSGTLTIAGQTVSVTQAGSGMAAVSSVSSIPMQGLSKPYGVAADNLGNLYVADAWNNTIFEWNA